MCAPETKKYVKRSKYYTRPRLSLGRIHAPHAWNTGCSPIRGVKRLLYEESVTHVVTESTQDVDTPSPVVGEVFKYLCSSAAVDHVVSITSVRFGVGPTNNIVGCFRSDFTVT